MLRSRRGGIGSPSPCYRVCLAVCAGCSQPPSMGSRAPSPVCLFQPHARQSRTFTSSRGSPVIGRTRRPSTITEYAMGLFSKDIQSLDDLFLHTLQDIYYAENHIAKALPKMIKKATSPQLKQGFE